MKKLFTAIFSFALVACGTAAPAQTAAPTATALPPTATFTPTVTATPTEPPLPEGPIADLQKQIGDQFKITQVEGSKDTFEIKGREGLKFNADGTAELEFNGEMLTVAPQVILRDKENPELLNIGPWQLDSEGEVTMLVAGAPKTVEEAEKFPKLAYLQGHPKEKEIDRTNRLYDQWSMAKDGNYDPLNEFEGVVVDGIKLDSANLTTPESWMLTDFGGERPVLYFTEVPSIVARNQGWSSLEVYDVTGNKLNDLLQIPIIDLDTDSSVVITTALINKSKLSRVLELLSNEGAEYPFLPAIIREAKITNQDIIEESFSDEELRDFMAYYNKSFFDMNILKSKMAKLPPEVSSMVYLDLGISSY